MFKSALTRVALVATILTLGATLAVADGAARERKTNPDFPTIMRPEPDSLKSVGKIPPGTVVPVQDMRVVQLDKFKENWYLVEYEGTSGWVRGDDLDGETAEKKFSVTYQAPDLPGVSGPGGVQF